MPDVTDVLSFRPQRETFAYRWLDQGFFSEYDRMLLGILRCMIADWNFELASRSPALPTRGWTTFFEPFCREFDSPIVRALDGRSFAERPRYRNLRNRLRRAVLLGLARPMAFPRRRFMVEEWEILRELQERKRVRWAQEGMDVEMPLVEALRAIHRRIWKPKADTDARIEREIARVAMPARYAGMHVRRGDKDMEVAHTSLADYVRRLESVTSLVDVFLATDDYTVLEELRALRPRWRIRCLCEPSMRGYTEAGWLAQTPQRCDEETFKLLVDMEILRRAEVFVGTFSSAIGEFQGIARDGATHGVDYDAWTMTY